VELAFFLEKASSWKVPGIWDLGSGIWDLRSVRSVRSVGSEICEIYGICEDSSRVNILSKLLTMSWDPFGDAGKALEDAIESVTPDFGSAKYPLLGVGTVVSMANTRIGAAIITAGGLTWAEEGGWMPAWFHLPWAKMTDDRRRDFNVAWGINGAAFTEKGTYTESMNPGGTWDGYNVGSAGVDEGDINLTDYDDATAGALLEDSVENSPMFD
jgi:hypothetical protein